MNPRLGWLALLAASACMPALAGDAEFEHIVKAIESHYGVHQTHIPFMGIANFVVKVAHPEGATGLKLAVFDGVRDEWRERDRFMDTIPGKNLRPFVRTHSHSAGNATYIFLGPEGRTAKSTRILIATFEHDSATVIEVQANVEKLLKSLEDPAHAKNELDGGI
jgi:hypothetical protein